MDLFTHAMNDRMQAEAPLAARMRPRTLDKYIGLAQRSCAEHHPRPGQAAMRSIALRTRHRG